MKLWWPWHNFSEIFLHFNYSIFTFATDALVGLWEFLALFYSLFALCSVDTVQINTNIVARSVPFIFIFYLYWDFIFCSVNMRKFSFPRYSCVLCVIEVCDSLNSSMCVVRPSNMAASIYLFRAVERVKKSFRYPRVWRFRLLDPFCALQKCQNCYLMLFVYLLVCRNS